MLKKLFIVALIFSLFFAAYFFLSRKDNINLKNVRNYPLQDGEIIAFGDSLVEGVGSVDDGDLFSVLSNRINEPILNFGRGGDTTSLALERLPKVLEEVPNPKLVIVLLGGNDFLRHIPKEETFKNLGEIVNAFQERGSAVLVLGIRGGFIKDNYENNYKEFSKNYKTGYVSNVLRGLIGKNDFMYDSIHPNNVGYSKIADRVEPILKKLLE